LNSSQLEPFRINFSPVVHSHPEITLETSGKDENSLETSGKYENLHSKQVEKMKTCHFETRSDEDILKNVESASVAHAEYDCKFP
jgi:hypothetical protein